MNRVKRLDDNFRRRLFCASSTAIVALSITIPVPTATASQLRGSVPAASTPQIIETKEELRGSAYEYDSIYAGDREYRSNAPADEYSESVIFGFGRAAKFSLRNSINSLLLSGSLQPDMRRDPVISLPDRASFRYSMMPDTNAFFGLRGSSATAADSVAAALRGSYSLRAQLERAKADRARVYGALSNFLPKVDVSLDYNNAPRTSASSIVTGREKALAIDAQVSVPIFSSGVNLNTYRQAIHASRASDFAFMAEEHRVAMEAISAHINLRLNRKIERTLASNVEAMRKIRRIADRLYEAGDASRTDIAIARANVENARSELNAARKLREEVLVDYETSTGLRAPQNLTLPQFTSVVPRSVNAAIETAMRFNPNIAAAHHTAAASRHAAKAERGKYGPQINVYGGYQKELHSSIDSNTEDSWNVGVRMNVPLVNFSRIPNINAARHDALEAKYRAADRSLAVERLVRRQWVAYHSARNRTGIIDRQLKAVIESATGTRREYEAGFRAITDVLNDQVKLASTRIALERSRHEQMIAAYELAFTTAHPGIRNLVVAEAN